MARPIHVVDVFTERPLTGNQLGVVLEAEGMDPAVMQKVARELNFAETTFVMRPENEKHTARVRIFTPATELPFAGHPTIGTSWVLYSEGRVPSGARELVLEENVGPVPVRWEGDPAHPRFWMTHPPLTYGEVFDRAGVAKAIGLTEGDLVPGVQPQTVSTGSPFVFVALRDQRAVDAARSSSELIGPLLKGRGAHGVFLFCAAGDHRLYSRMFAPSVLDIVEDPATGSASGPLGAYAVRHGLVPRGDRVAMVSEQGTKMGRQAFVHIALDYAGAGDIPSRIEVGGSVRPVLKGTLVAEGT